MKLSAIFLSSLWLSSAVAEPPRHIPEGLVEQFTMGGRIPLLDWYIDNSVPDDHPTLFEKSDIDHYMQLIQKKESGYYGNHLDNWLYEALEKHPIAGKEVGIFGSIKPFYECVVIAYGGRPITVEYNKIVSEDPRFATLTVEEYNQNPRKFDVILSISSIEHDGLGRFGDPINPDGDLDFMRKAKSLLKEDGCMILAVPVGQDCLIWNAARVYGKLRFPLLIMEWDLMDSIGFSERDFTERPLGDYPHQPILVLTPKWIP